MLPLVRLFLGSVLSLLSRCLDAFIRAAHVIAMGGQSAPSFVLSISLLLLLLLVSVLEPSQSLAVDQAVNGWYKPVNTRDSAWGSAALRPRLNVNPRAIITTSTSTSAPTTIEENDHVDAINPRALVFPSEGTK